MSRRTALGSLAAAALTTTVTTTLLVGAAPAQAKPTWVHDTSISALGAIPSGADVVLADDGSAVAAWVRKVGPDLRVQAASATHGVWGSVSTISDAGRDASAPAVAVNDDGQAVVTWIQPDLDENLRLAASRRLPNGTWDGRALVSPINENVQDAADVGLDGNGRLLAAYTTVGANNVQVVRASSWKSGAAPQSSVVSGSGVAAAPALAVNDAGTALVSFYRPAQGQSTIQATRLAAGAETWTPATEVSAPGQHEAITDVALNDAGFGTIALVGDWQGDMRVQTAKVQPDGYIGNLSFASPSGQDASHPDVELNAAGDALMAWTSMAQGKSGIGFATRKQTGDWNHAALTVGVTDPTPPRAMISDTGTTMISYAGSGRLLAAYRTKSLLPFTQYDSGDQSFVKAEHVADMDDRGDVFLGGVVPGGQAGTGQLGGAFLDVAGPAATVSAPSTVVAGSATVKWSAKDRLSGIADSDVLVRRAAWNGAFGKQTYAADGTDATSLKVALAPGQTACVTTQVRDTVGNLSTWTAERCTTAPVDDRKLSTAKGFKRAKGASHFRGTITTATKKGAKLTLGKVSVHRLALVVTKSAKAGAVRVSLGGQKLGTFSLKGTGTKRIVPVKTFASTKSGKLVITVVSRSGKPVKIDGVVIAK